MVSSLELVGALRRGGFIIRSATDHHVLLARGDRSIVIPRHRNFADDEVSFLLLGSGIAAYELQLLMKRPPPKESGRVNVFADLDEKRKAR
jgi:hypothetical protein